MYLVSVKNPRTGKWMLVKNSHWASLSGVRGASPSRSMRWGDVARAYAASYRRQGYAVRVRKVG